MPDVKYGDGSIRIRTRKDGRISYQARWYDGRKMRAKTFHGSIEDAEDFLRKRARDVRSGRYVADEDVELLQAVDDYLARGERDWEPSTQATYQSVRKVIEKHSIASTRLSDITPRQCQLWIDELVSVYSPSRMVVVRALMNGVMKEAMRLGIINANPMHGVRMPSPKRREYDLWTPEDGRRALELSTGYLHTYYMLALTTGMRPGEIRALLWKDINLDAGVITVSATMTRDAKHSPIRGTTTKGGHSRKVLIPSEVVDELRSHRVRQAERQLKAEVWHDAGYVFDRGDGQFMPQQTIWRQHREFTKYYGLPQCRLHDLRHFAASTMFRAGIDIKVIAETLGHKTVRTTQEVYAHVDENQQREVADLMRSVLSLSKEAN